jgi:hypothetical protein
MCCLNDASRHREGRGKRVKRKGLKRNLAFFGVQWSEFRIKNGQNGLDNKCTFRGPGPVLSDPEDAIN